MRKSKRKPKRNNKTVKIRNKEVVWWVKGNPLVLRNGKWVVGRSW